MLRFAEGGVDFEAFGPGRAGLATRKGAMDRQGSVCRWFVCDCVGNAGRGVARGIGSWAYRESNGNLLGSLALALIPCAVLTCAWAAARNSLHCGDPTSVLGRR
jgi:hypothetical protein